MATPAPGWPCYSLSGTSRCRKIIDFIGEVLSLKIDFENTVDWFAQDCELIEGTPEQALMYVPALVRQDDDKAGVDRDGGVELAKVVSVVGHDYEIALTGIARYVPVLPAGFSYVHHMMRFVTSLGSHGNKVQTQTFIDQKSHAT
jgi:hypothetical protein